MENHRCYRESFGFIGSHRVVHGARGSQKDSCGGAIRSYRVSQRAIGLEEPLKAIGSNGKSCIYPGAVELAKEAY